MPLRDHFRPLLDLKHSWDALHGGWPMVIVQYLFTRLPEGYVAAPGVHLGSACEIDVSTYAEDEPTPGNSHGTYSSNGGVATATAVWAQPAPTLTLETETPEQDEYEVRVYDTRRGRTLVAAVEIISPSNKDRPDSRRVLVAKMANLLHQGVCVSLVDLVTVRQFNLYADLLGFLGHADPALGEEPPALYAATLRRRKQVQRPPLLDTWFYPMQLGQPLPPLPLWLDADKGVPLDLEATYEDTCRFLHIR